MLILNDVKQVGLQEPVENDARLPAGDPATEKDSCWALPETKVAVTVFVVDEPGLIA